MAIALSPKRAMLKCYEMTFCLPACLSSLPLASPARCVGWWQACPHHTRTVFVEMSRHCEVSVCFWGLGEEKKQECSSKGCGTRAPGRPNPGAGLQPLCNSPFTACCCPCAYVILDDSLFSSHLLSQDFIIFFNVMYLAWFLNPYSH